MKQIFIMILLLGSSLVLFSQDIKKEPLVIGGHLLPPEPDPAINNSTLLGIDSNNNGVRDDVERWIYMTYSKPIERAVMMQSARAYQIVIQEPEKAKENLYHLLNASDCESYWSFRAKREGEDFWLERYRNYTKEIRPVQFNTGERFLAKEKFNQALNGEVFGDTKIDRMKEKCDFDTSALMKASSTSKTPKD